ncbi:MAG: glutathione S-transferase [Candidatus Azotimanducaceae bacterium]|jgi:glutathione S-transferase
MTTILYQHPLSGHSHRVRLMLALLNIKATIYDVDLMTGEHKAPEFLAKNAAGQVPVLEDGEHTLSDSNAILVYLATRHDPSGHWYPEEPVRRAKIQKFLSIAAGPVASGPAAARLVNVFGAGLDMENAKNVATTILGQLNDHLADNSWLAGSDPTIADVANYAYIAHAPEGDVSLAPYAHVTRWLAQIEALPGFVPMVSTEVGLAA